MAKLYDMEELVSHITDENMKSYMREALTCYMTGAYRATVVLTYIALFDDIYNKLEELAKVNKKAAKILKSATQKKDEQQVFENDLMTSLSGEGLINGLDATFLDILRQLRNKSAHPSGHQPSAEEARFVFYESITKFLSKPILTTTQLVSEIMIKLNDGNFFHENTLETLSAVVKKELQGLDPNAISVLLNYLIRETENDKKETDIHLNSLKFLNGLAHSEIFPNVLEEIRKRIITPKCSNSNFFTLICQLISSNGNLIKELDDVTYGRLCVVFEHRIDEVTKEIQTTRLSHPLQVFLRMFQNNTDTFTLEKFKKPYEKLISKFLYSPYLLTNITDFDAARGVLIEAIIQRAGSKDFIDANNFAKNSHTIDKHAEKIISECEAFQVLTSVKYSADLGAFGSEGLLNGKFSSMPIIKKKAETFTSNNNEEAMKIYLELFEEENEKNYKDFIDNSINS